MASNFRAAEINPKRWAWARGRAEVLGDYLAIKGPSVRDADEAAAKLGIKRRAFYYMLDRSRGTPRSKGAVEHPIQASAEVSRKTIVKRRRKEHAGTVSTIDECSRIAIDHVPLEIAIRSDEGKVPGYLTVVLDRLNGAILGHSLGVAPPGPGSVLAAMVDWLAKNEDRIGTPIDCLTVHSDTDQDWRPFIRTLRHLGIQRIGRRITRLPMGSFLFERMDKLGSISLRPRLASAKLAERISALPEVDLCEAQAIVGEAIRAWNSNRPMVGQVVAPGNLLEALLAHVGRAH